MNEVALLGMLICNSLLQAQSAFFFSRPATNIVKATVGDNITFPWNFTLGSREEFLLMKLEYSKIYSFETTSVGIAYRTKEKLSIVDAFKGRVLVQQSGALTLLNVSIENQGFYKCQIELNGGAPLWDKVQLLVGAPPVIQHIFPSTDITLLEGEDVKLSCHVSGQPAPSVFWYWKQMQTTEWKKIGVNSFELTHAKLSNSGNYQCYSSNYMGDASRTVKIQVYERPKVTSFFNTAALDGTIFECQQVCFTCEAFDQIPPVTSFHLYHNERLIVADSKTGKFRISEVRKKDEGRYYCVPENEHGLGYNKTIELKVNAAPDNCKKTSRTSSKEINEVQTTMSSYLTGQLIKPSDKSSSFGRRSSSQALRPCLITLALWTLHLAFNCCL